MESDVIISSRIRLARNIRGQKFPHKLSRDEAKTLVERTLRAIDKLGDFSYRRLSDMDESSRQMLVEDNVISAGLLSSPYGAYARSNDDTVTIMLCEEDHIRLSCILDGLSLRKCYDIASDIDTELNRTLDYCYSGNLGYITACPSNVGTGMRASVMLFLPALTMAGSIPDIVTTLDSRGITLRGSRGEGSGASHYIYQVSNEVTLGKSEQDLITMIENTVLKLVELEKSAREDLLENNFDYIMDKAHRAYGILSHAYSISSAEAIEQLAALRVGVVLGLIKIKDASTIEDITNNIKPYHIANRFGAKTNDTTRDRFRAEYLRQIFRGTLIE